MRFVLAIHEEDAEFGVTVPDLPGCFSAGDTLEEAIEGAHEAIDGHVELLIEGGNGLPEFRTLDQHRANQDLAGALWVVIEVPVERYFGPAEKINITVPALTLKRIDAHAVQRGESRSGFLVHAAEEAMRAGNPWTMRRVISGTSAVREPAVGPVGEAKRATTKGKLAKEREAPAVRGGGRKVR